MWCLRGNRNTLGFHWPMIIRNCHLDRWWYDVTMLRSNKIHLVFYLSICGKWSLYSWFYEAKEMHWLLAVAHHRVMSSLQVMHDEVSETENIRKNLAIERMIVEGCDILLDVNQTFVRQGKPGWEGTLVFRGWGGLKVRPQSCLVVSILFAIVSPYLFHAWITSHFASFWSRRYLLHFSRVLLEFMTG